jgi:hypothetical protein
MIATMQLVLLLANVISISNTGLGRARTEPSTEFVRGDLANGHG